jgi:hypothetical protein
LNKRAVILWSVFAAIAYIAFVLWVSVQLFPEAAEANASTGLRTSFQLVLILPVVVFAAWIARILNR